MLSFFLSKCNTKREFNTLHFEEDTHFDVAEAFCKVLYFTRFLVYHNFLCFTFMYDNLIFPMTD